MMPLARRHLIVRSDGVRQHYYLKDSIFRKNYSKISRGVYFRNVAVLHERVTVEGYAKREEAIREALFHSIDRVNRKLAYKVPVAYDPEEALWVVNDYTAANGRNIPIEIKIRHAHGRYKVVSYQWRGREIAARQRLQANLNEY